MKRYLIPSLLIGLSVLVVMIFPKGISFLEDSTGQETSSQITTLHWKTLQGLNVKDHSITPELKAAIGTRVKIPGFAVPLSDSLSSVDEFLLVPNQQACIHVPPPPPNLIIHVRLPKALSMEEIAGPLWAEGILRLKTIESMYGSSSWILEDITIQPYEW